MTERDEVSELQIRRSTELSLPMRPLEESTRLIREHEQGAIDTALAHLDHRVQQGRELASVKVNETYGEKQYTNFDVYCREELPFRQKTARRLMLLYKVTKAAREAGEAEPTSVKQMEVLMDQVSGGDEDRVEAWLELSSQHGPEISTRAIRGRVVPGDDAKSAESEQPELQGKVVEIVTADGEVIQVSDIKELADVAQEQIEKLSREALEGDRLLEQIEKRKREIEAERKKLQKELKQEREALESRTAKLDKQYAQALANALVRHGIEDVKVPDFLNVSQEAFAQAIVEGKSARIKEVAKRMHEVTTLARWMGGYLPGEAAAAIGDMDHTGSLTEALRYVIDWLQGVVEEVEATVEERR